MGRGGDCRDLVLVPASSGGVSPLALPLSWCNLWDLKTLRALGRQPAFLPGIVFSSPCAKSCQGKKGNRILSQMWMIRGVWIV